jgi:mRNA-degrading endonuclease RelE of RelBE toxin-antitoxin system
MFDVILHPSAAKFLEKADHSVSSEVKKKLLELQEHPEHRGKHLRYTAFWSLRVGDYRAIYEVRKPRTVVVLFIGHRSDVYDDFSKIY